jgi:hypothetical protein
MKRPHRHRLVVLRWVTECAKCETRDTRQVSKRQSQLYDTDFAIGSSKTRKCPVKRLSLPRDPVSSVSSHGSCQSDVSQRWAEQDGSLAMLARRRSAPKPPHEMARLPTRQNGRHSATPNSSFRAMPNRRFCAATVDSVHWDASAGVCTNYAKQRPPCRHGSSKAPTWDCRSVPRD